MSDTPVSPLAPQGFPALPQVAGVELATLAANLRYRGRPDIMLARLAPGTTLAGVLTRNKMAGAPIEWCRKQLPRGRARALLVNAGNANVFTGRAGAEAVRQAALGVADTLGCPRTQVMIASTGVIGERLEPAAVLAALPRLAGRLKADAWPEAADAIRTTDTFAKAAGATARIDGEEVAIVGIAKGSGMIAPDMATMLAFVFTDAGLPADVLQGVLGPINRRTFNSITVDGDTSTSDMVLLFATGRARAGKAVAKPSERRLGDFKAALEAVMGDLARQVVRDGEGASKLIEIRVAGAASRAAARRIGLAIGNSPLVKTAIAGEDANWGRIVMAVGKSGEMADRDRLAIRIGGVLVAEKGHVHPDYREAEVVAHMKSREIEIEVDVGVGRGRATVWACDLTHGYISINADYRS